MSLQNQIKFQSEQTHKQKHYKIMETAERVLPPNPRDQAKLLSIIFFTWTIPFLKKGYRKVLELNDIFRVLNDDRSDLLGDRLEQ